MSSTRTRSNIGGTQDEKPVRACASLWFMVQVLLLVWDFCYWWSWVVSGRLQGLGGGREGRAPTQSIRADLRTKAGTGQRLLGKMGSGCSRGRSTFSHLYSPKVQSSSFMGWNSGSVCASSFSLTSETIYTNQVTKLEQKEKHFPRL